MSVAHRRAGKTVARINKLVRAAATCEKPDPRFGYLAPYFVQAKDIAWNYLKHCCPGRQGAIQGEEERV